MLNLSESVNRLAKALEKEAGFSAEEREARRVDLAISILGLRYRKIERLEGELRDLLRKEDNWDEAIKMMKAEVEAQEDKRRAELSQTTTEEKRMAASYEKEIKHLEGRITRLAEQKAVVQNQINAERRRLDDLEAIVDAWLTTLH